MSTIKIQWTAEFILPLSFDLIAGLRDVAVMHYDSTCREAAEPAGLLGRMARMEVCRITHIVLSFRELDLLRKVSESKKYLVLIPERSEAIDEFVKAADAAYIFAQAKYDVLNRDN